MSISVYKDGEWKEAQSLSVQHEGVWKEAQAAWTYEAGEWKDLMGPVAYTGFILKVSIPSDNFELMYPIKNPSPDATIDWGDGNIEPATENITHTYATAGDYYVEFKGLADQFKGGDMTSDKTIGMELTQWGNTPWQSCERMFYGFSSLNITATDIPNFSNVTSMSRMFNGCTNLTSVDFTNFDTSNVIYMDFVFLSCYNIDNIDISNFDTSNVITMRGFFSSCRSLKNVNVSNIDLSNVTDIGYFFSGCEVLETIDLSTWNTSNITDMASMFQVCNLLTSLDISGFDTGNVENMRYMFYNCYALTEIIGINDLDVSSVSEMNHMFTGCENLTSIDLSNWTGTSLTTAETMFMGCISVTSINVQNLITSACTTVDGIFRDCHSLQTVTWSGWDTSNVIEMGNMFLMNTIDNTALTTLDVSGFDTGNVTEMHNMFKNCKSLDVDISTWNFQNVLFMTDMFSETSFGNENYDKFLVAASQQSLQNDVTFHAGDAQYTEASARAVLTDTYNWTIYDGGQIVTELLVNSDFSLGLAGWAYNHSETRIYYDSGKLVLYNSADSPYDKYGIIQSFSGVSPNKEYKVTIVVDSVVDGDMNAHVKVGVGMPEYFGINLFDRSTSYVTRTMTLGGLGMYDTIYFYHHGLSSSDYSNSDFVKLYSGSDSCGLINDCDFDQGDDTYWPDHAGVTFYDGYIKMAGTTAHVAQLIDIDQYDIESEYTLSYRFINGDNDPYVSLFIKSSNYDDSAGYIVDQSMSFSVGTHEITFTTPSDVPDGVMFFMIDNLERSSKKAFISLISIQPA